MPKPRLTFNDWVMGIYAGSELSYLPYDTTEFFHEKKKSPRFGSMVLVILSNDISPEKKLMLQDIYANMSVDARWLLHTLCNDPDQLLSGDGKRNRITLYGLQRKLKQINNWGSSRSLKALRDLATVIKESRLQD